MRGGLRRVPAPRAVLAVLLLTAALVPPAGPPCLGAQSTARVLESVLLPPRFFVGDRVELRLRLSVPAGAELGAPQAGEGESWVRVDRVEVEDRRRPDQEGEVRVRVFFTPFVPGEGSLPALDLGGVRVAPQEFTTASVRERERDPALRPLRGQLLLPLTRLRLALTVVVLIGAPLLLVLGGLWTSRLVGRLGELRRRRRPAQRARGALHRLEQGLARSETRVLYEELSRVLKRYLGERLGLPTSSATTAEVEGLLGGVGMSAALGERVQEVLHAADTAKFSGRAGRRSAARSSLKKVREIVGRVEELCDVGS